MRLSAVEAERGDEGREGSGGSGGDDSGSFRLALSLACTFNSSGELVPDFGKQTSPRRALKSSFDHHLSHK